ncbi:P-loop containing nucleoside triphosphate hydrolase protein [Penicillium longicatenatum]|nr:P-loop containing nucleoside triphosphate hydrolase protein [Penicillium longicatenatum]
MYELYPLFVTSLAQFTASIFPTTQAAQVNTGFAWLVVNTFNGLLAAAAAAAFDPARTNAMRALDIIGKDSELSAFNAPSSETCGSYAATFFGQSNLTGYLVEASATGQCEYCMYINVDQYRSRNVGIFIGFLPVQLHNGCCGDVFHLHLQQADEVSVMHIVLD